MEMALGLGLEAEWFWNATPYLTTVAIRGRSRCRIESALYTGWFAERFAREKELQGPQHYIDDMLNSKGASEAVQLAMAQAELTRMALTWGLEVEDIAEDG